MSLVGKWLRAALDVALPATSDQRAVLTTELGDSATADQLVWVGKDASGNYAKSVIAPRTQLIFLGATPSIAPASGAGTTGAISSPGGVDANFAFTLTPGGTGIAAGAVATVAFANAMPSSGYNVLSSARNAAAGPVAFYVTNRTASGFTLNVVSALTSGVAYNFGFTIAGY